MSTDLLSVQVPAVEKEGYLEKEGGNVKSWRLRWFILQDRKLHYFRNRKDGKPAGSIDLVDAEVVVVDDFYRKKKYEYLFQIKVANRTYNIIAPDFETRRSWVEALNKKLSRKSHDSSSGGSSANSRNSDNKTTAAATSSRPGVASPTSDFSESSDEEEDHPQHITAPTNGGLSALRPVHQAIRERIITSKACIESLLYVNAEKLLNVVKDTLESINCLLNDCYYFVSLEEDNFRQQTVLKHSANIENSFKKVLQSAKNLAVKQKSGQNGGLQEARQDLQTVVYNLLSVLDELRTDNTAMESALSSKEIAVPVTAATYRTSLMRASRNLEAAMDELEKFSSSSSSGSQRAGEMSPTRRSSTRTSPSSMQGFSAVLITSHDRKSVVLPPRSHSSPTVEANQVPSLRLPPRTTSAPQDGDTVNSNRSSYAHPADGRESGRSSASPRLQVNERSNRPSNASQQLDIPRKTQATSTDSRQSFFDADLSSFDALDQILEALNVELETST